MLKTGGAPSSRHTDSAFVSCRNCQQTHCVLSFAAVLFAAVSPKTSARRMLSGKSFKLKMGRTQSDAERLARAQAKQVCPCH